jgi:hypothetical protein
MDGTTPIGPGYGVCAGYLVATPSARVVPAGGKVVDWGRVLTRPQSFERVCSR